MSKRRAGQSKKTQPPNTSIDDPATAYAQAVVDGEIVAGPHVRAACRRHVTDLERGHERGLSWDLEAANRAIGFFRDVLTVEIEYEDEDGETASEAVPFVLEPSQCFIVGSLFGWKNRLGYRRFRRAFIEQGKGNGKSPLAAGIGHYMLVATKKIRAEVYSAATDKDQAAILFRDAVAMWSRSPHLASRLVPSGQNPVWQLTDMHRQSFFKPISSEKKGKSGIRPYCALIDEVHEHPDNSVIEMLRAGTKGNKQALIFEITNSGFDRQSVCWSEHDYSVKVAHGTVENDAWFSYVCALDEDEDPFEDEACWIKANPLVGVSIQPEFIREQVEEARGMPSKESTVRRLHFCEWTEADNPFVSAEIWKKNGRKAEEWGPVFGGLDLSEVNDLTCLLLASPVNRTLNLKPTFWLPEHDLKKRSEKERVPYDVWHKQGWLQTTPGRSVEYEYIAKHLVEVFQQHDVRKIAFDRWNMRHLKPWLIKAGMPESFIDEHFVEFGQGFASMSPALRALESMLLNARVAHGNHPVLTMCAANAVVKSDDAGNRKLSKAASRGRIDGMVALAMAASMAEEDMNQGPVFPVDLKSIVEDIHA